MSLYVFNVKKDSAIVTADTRMCVDVGGELYRLNDTTEKLRVMDDMVITTGGVAWVGVYLLEVWKQSPDHSVKHLHELTLAALPYINMLAVSLGAAEQDYLSNPYLLEFCILRYDPLVGHNVFYHIATSSEYELLEFHVDGVKRPSAQMFGGIDFEPVQEYFGEHTGQVKTDYISAVRTAYELVTSEKIGGNLLIAKMNKGDITLEKISLKDSKPIRDYVVPNGVTYNICGKNLNIVCPDVNGGVSKVAIDSLGFFMHNGRYYMSGDGDAGRIGMDSHWGIFGGPKALFDVTDTGYVKPSFVGDDGNMLLDKDGFPKDTDFLLGMKGKHFFRGTIHATDGIFNGTVYAKDGEFKGVVKAEDFMLKSGDSMQSILNNKGQIKGGFIDMRGANILNDAGERVLYLDETGLHWDPKFSPFKTQYSVTANGPWHDTYTANDEYRRDSTDGGITWGPGIKYVAKDGRPGANGTDASVNYANIKSALEKASGIPSAFMSVNEMGAPEIFGGKIYGAEIYAGGVGTKGGQIIGLTDKGIQIYDGVGSKVLKIQGLNGGANLTTQDNPLHLSSPDLSFGDAGRISFRGSKADFTEVNEVDFTGVKTTGLHITFA